MRRTPPSLGLRLLDALLPEDQRDAVIGDLTEAYERDVHQRPLRARMAFWREVVGALFQLQAVPHGVSAYEPTRESLVQSFLSDLRHAVRVLRRAPAFTFLCVVTLGLATGAAAAIVSVANPLLLRVVPYPDGSRLVVVNERAGDGAPNNVGYATYADLRQDARSLRSSAAFGSWNPTQFGGKDAERLRGMRVTWEFFRTLGVTPVLGRDFVPEDDTPDNYDVVILSHGLWQRRFGGDAGIVGRAIDLGDTRPVVVGVLPASFDNVLDPTAQIYRALGYANQDWACRTCRHLRMIGRLEDSVTHASAATELNGLMQRMAVEHAPEHPGAGVIVERLAERVTRGTRTIFITVMGAVALLLLIAVANVANMQLARAARREDEFAVRAALGAGRGRIARQLFAEGLVIAICGGALGVALAAALLPSLVASLPSSLPRLGAVRLDWTVLAVISAIVLVASLVLGTVPAVHSGRRQLFDAIRASRSGAAYHRARSVLVVTEIALAMVLLVGAGLLGRSLLSLLAVDMGFDARGVVTMEVQAVGPAYTEDDAVLVNHDRIRAAARAVPGVVEVGLVSQLPLGGSYDRYGVRERDLPDGASGAEAERYTVSADYMRAMRIPIVEGRGFTDEEARDSTARVAIVSRSLARRMWPEGTAIGTHVRVGGGDRPAFRIIGVAADVRHTGLDEAQSQQVYVPERHWHWVENTLVLVARVQPGFDPSAAAFAVRDAVLSVDQLQPISRIMTMEQVVARSTAQRRLGAMLFIAFGAIALLLAAAGIYGLLAGAVAERMREFGVRSALGASAASIVRLVARQGMLLAACGLAAGAIAALALSRYVRSLLYGLSATDPLTVLLAGVAIVLTAGVACAIPALRATAVDPATALRAE